jgi:peroxiredoxin
MSPGSRRSFETNKDKQDMPIAVGEQAPDFELKNSSGEAFRLSDLHGVRRVMLVFYPKDMTSG